MGFTTSKLLHWFVLAGSAAVSAGTGSTASCKPIPGDPAWPTNAEWAQLNRTVGGRLIATVPEASVCHYDPYHDYNATACDALKPGWDFPQAQ